MSRFRLAARLALLLSSAGAPTLAAQGASHYHVIKRVVIGKASADYIVVDGAGRRLYGLGDNVFDVFTKAQGEGLDGTKYKDW